MVKLHYFREDGDVKVMAAKGFLRPALLSDSPVPFGSDLPDTPTDFYYYLQATDSPDRRVMQFNHEEKQWEREVTDDYTFVGIDKAHSIYYADDSGAGDLKIMDVDNNYATATIADIEDDVLAAIEHPSPPEQTPTTDASIFDWRMTGSGVVKEVEVLYSASGDYPRYNGTESFLVFVDDTGSITVQQLSYRILEEIDADPANDTEEFSGPHHNIDTFGAVRLYTTRDRLIIRGNWQDTYSGSTRDRFRVYNHSGTFQHELSGAASNSPIPFQNGYYRVTLGGTNYIYNSSGTDVTPTWPTDKKSGAADDAIAIAQILSNGTDEAWIIQSPDDVTGPWVFVFYDSTGTKLSESQVLPPASEPHDAGSSNVTYKNFFGIIGHNFDHVRYLDWDYGVEFAKLTHVVPDHNRSVRIRQSCFCDLS